jgi:hypothetical protein
MTGMLLRTVYTITSTNTQGLADLDLPLTFAVDGGVSGTLSAHAEGTLRLVLERTVDPSALELVTETRRYRIMPDGSEEPAQALRLREDEASDHVVALDLLSALSFLTDIPLWLSRPIHEDRFVAQTDADRAKLEAFGTDEVYDAISGRSQIRSFGEVVLDSQFTVILPRRAGLRLYADALKLGSDVAQFREFWRVLESAFGITDEELVAAIAKFPPAQAMEFGADELRSLLILRGRSSHAASKAGVHELTKVQRECSHRLPRLKNLAERVIATKANWGYPTAGVNELLPLSAYIGPPGGPDFVIIKRNGSSSDPNET